MEASRCMPFIGTPPQARNNPKLAAAAGAGGGMMPQGKGAPPPYEVRNRYHSQGLAAGGSALLDAINRGKVHLAKFILDAGEYDIVNTRDFKGKTPLIRACYIKEEKTRDRAMALLMSRGADVNLQDEQGRTPLSYACEHRTNDVVRLLVKNNVDPDIADAKGNTPLIYSAIVGNDTAIEILIKSFRRLGLNIDHVNDDGLNALLIAAKHGFIECASMLALDGRACISFRDREKGLNAEEWARAHGCTSPEILPLCASAGLWQYKLNRYGKRYGLLEDDGRETDVLKEDDELGEGRRNKEGNISIDEMNKQLAQTQIKAKPKVSVMSKGDRVYHKRGSLPSIKFSITSMGLSSSSSSGKRSRKKSFGRPFGGGKEDEVEPEAAAIPPATVPLQIDDETKKTLEELDDTEGDEILSVTPPESPAMLALKSAATQTVIPNGAVHGQFDPSRPQSADPKIAASLIGSSENNGNGSDTAAPQASGAQSESRGRPGSCSSAHKTCGAQSPTSASKVTVEVNTDKNVHKTQENK